MASGVEWRNLFLFFYKISNFSDSHFFIFFLLASHRSAPLPGKLLKNDKNAPSSFLPTLKPFLVSLICMAMFVVGGAKFPILDPSDPQHNSPPWVKAHLPFLKRYCYQWVALFFCRQKYYFAWKNAEGANNIWFAGYEGRDEDAKIIGWDHANNVDIVAFETAPNIKICSAAWNKKTSNWLTRYVYMRTGGSLIATYSMSAFWHGFYPGYYMFFMSMPLLTACERVGRKKLSPVFSTGGKWSPWGIVTILTTSFLGERANRANLEEDETNIIPLNSNSNSNFEFASVWLAFSRVFRHAVPSAGVGVGGGDLEEPLFLRSHPLFWVSFGLRLVAE